MNIRKLLIKLAKKREALWQSVDFSISPVRLKAGWYVTEFIVPGSSGYTPRIVVESAHDKIHQRKLIGFHSGRNRMLIYLPAGRLLAVSESIEFTTLARVPWWEGRARILLICFRYLTDFFSPPLVLRMIALQFKKPFDLSTGLSFFYASPDALDYLHNVLWWEEFKKYRPQLSWWCRGVKIAVLIQDDAQRAALNDLLVPPDAILLLNRDKEIPQGVDYLIPLARTEQLRGAAILILKRAIKKVAAGKAKLIYTDHDYRYDECKGDQVMLPVFKPQPSAVYLHCYNYLGPSVAFAVSEVSGRPLSTLFDEEQQYRMALRIFENTADVLHISEALFISDRQESIQTPEPDSDAVRWSDVHWQRQKDYNVLRADLHWQEKPSVDLIIPTRDGLAVLQPCVDSILKLTEYPNYQITLVDNGSEQSATHDYFASVIKDHRVRVLEYPGEFNFSAINNYAVAQGTSDYVAMVNNDIEVIHGDWLEQMMVWAKQPNVGIVGAKLLFADGRVQHAGVTIGMGNAAGHLHRLEAGESPGYQNRCVATQNMMAVTAACLLTPRALFEQLGGLDADFLKVAYNDIDYCLRVDKLGKEIIWTPEARLYHHESVSRGDDMAEQHIERYFYELGVLQKRWKTKGFVDKYYSKHLRMGDEGVYPRITVEGDDSLRYF